MYLSSTNTRTHLHTHFPPPAAHTHLPVVIKQEPPSQHYHHKTNLEGLTNIKHRAVACSYFLRIFRRIRKAQGGGGGGRGGRERLLGMIVAWSMSLMNRGRGSEGRGLIIRGEVVDSSASI